jgi:hypothetical protein
VPHLHRPLAPSNPSSHPTRSLPNQSSVYRATAWGFFPQIHLPLHQGLETEEWKKKEEVGETRTAAPAPSPWQPAG